MSCLSVVFFHSRDIPVPTCYRETFIGNYLGISLILFLILALALI